MKKFDFKLEELSGVSLGVVTQMKRRPLITFNLANAWVNANRANSAAIIPIAVLTHYIFQEAKGCEGTLDFVNSILDATGEHLHQFQVRKETGK